MRLRVTYQSKLKPNKFDLHFQAVESLFSPSIDLFHKSISDDLLKKLSVYSKKTVKNNVFGCTRLPDEQNDLLVEIPNKSVLDSLNDILIVHPLHELDGKNELLRDLHSELRELFQQQINAPFVFVNSRMWTTRPSSERYGQTIPNCFEAGHLKIMVYLTPMDENTDISIPRLEVSLTYLQEHCLIQKLRFNPLRCTWHTAKRISIEITMMTPILMATSVLQVIFLGDILNPHSELTRTWIASNKASRVCQLSSYTTDF